MPAPIMPGAEPISMGSGHRGALLVHGFCGSPFGMRRTAARLAEKGFSVEAPLLPGHGTSVEDMLTFGWKDWSSAVEEAYTGLRSRCETVAVIGHSMGGTLTCWLAERHPEIRGIAVVNALVQPFGDELRSGARALLEAGTAIFRTQNDAPDTADPTVTFPTYDGTPLAAFLSLNEGTEEVSLDLARITCPVLVVTSEQDHVVAPSNSDFLASSVSGSTERMWLERSYHNAMVDYEHEEVEARLVAFVLSVISAAGDGGQG